MDIAEIGNAIRRCRLARGLTQAQLAAAAHVTRTTLNQLENGVIRDLGIRKVQAILDQLGLVLVAQQPLQPRPPDFLRIASATASVSFKNALTEQELLRALLTGRIAAHQRPHFRMLLEESTPAVMQGLVRQVSRWTKPGKVEKNLARIAAAIDFSGSAGKWSTND